MLLPVLLGTRKIFGFRASRIFANMQGSLPKYE